MSPPPKKPHSRRANRIAKLLDRLLPEGVSLVEEAVSTPEGVKVPDVIWYGPERAEASDADPDEVLSSVIPDLCVEVESPRNTAAEFEGKRAAYFPAGAQEVWLCDLKGKVTFHRPEGPLERSALCPGFPLQIPAKLRPGS